MLKLTRVFTTLLLVSIVYVSLLAAPPRNKLIGQRYFDIVAPSFDLAKQTETVLLDAREDAIVMLGDEVTERISVHIVESRDEFVRMTRGALPDWGIGCAIPSENTIVIISPEAMEYDKPFYEIVRHEWAHIALRHRVGRGYLPRFLDEGFAMHFANQWNTSYSLTLAKSGLTGSWFNLRQIDKVNFFNTSQAQIAYAQSFQAVQYFLEMYGMEALQILLDELRDGANLDQALHASIGAGIQTFEIEYNEYLRNHYSWYIIFTDMSIIWIGLAFLIVLAFLLKKKKGKDTIKRWEEEEKYQSTDFDYEEGDPWD